jgi:uncharacterized protein YajQ (UPF0234 family)
MAESTFDIVSDYDRQEVMNVVDQVRREIVTRYDLKDAGIELTLGENDLVISAESELHVAAVRDLIQTRALRRQLSLKIFAFGSLATIAGGRVRQTATLQRGIAEDIAKRIQKLIRDQYPRVQARIQGDALRVGSKSRDDLQAVIRLVKERQDEFSIPLQFTNYR